MKWMTLLLGLLLIGCPSVANDDDVADDDDAANDDDAVANDDDAADDDDATAPADRCAPLPAPTGTVVPIEPSQVGQLQALVSNAEPGTTFVLAAGTYALNGDYLWIDAPGVGLRGATGDPEDVVIDGGYVTTEIVTVAASNVTIADLTIQRAYTHPIHVTGGQAASITNTLLHNLRVIDPGQQAIKINTAQGGQTFADAGVVSCSWIELTDAGRTSIRDNCYTGGIDAHQARDWVVRDNTIAGFWCEQGLSEHGVHFWRGGRDTVVERNELVNNARGIGFGLTENGDDRAYDDAPCPGANGHVGHFGGVIRNNTMLADDPELFASQFGMDGGVALAQSCGAQVLHNTVYATQAPFASIEWRFPNTDARIANNLVSHPMRERSDAVAELVSNREDATAVEFVDAAGWDLHLAAGAAAIDAGTPDSAVFDDVDAEPRTDAAPDLGADER